MRLPERLGFVLPGAGPGRAGRQSRASGPRNNRSRLRVAVVRHAGAGIIVFAEAAMVDPSGGPDFAGHRETGGALRPRLSCHGGAPAAGASCEDQHRQEGCDNRKCRSFDPPHHDRLVQGQDGPSPRKWRGRRACPGSIATGGYRVGKACRRAAPISLRRASQL